MTHITTIIIFIIAADFPSVILQRIDQKHLEKMYTMVMILFVMWPILVTCKSVILDTDIGDDMDDALALAVLLQSEEVDVVAVTTVGYDSYYRALAAARLIRLSGNKTRHIPVHQGEERPIDLGVFIPPFPYDDGLMVNDMVEEKVSSVRAVEAMIGYIEQYPGVDIILIGPTTNLGLVLKKRPDLVEKIGSISIMGGYPERVMWCGRNTSYFLGQFNLAADPTASMIILKNADRIPIKFIGLDVTRQVWLDDSHYQRLAEASQNSKFLQVFNLALEFFHLWLDYRCPVDSPYVFLHDPLTAISSFNESFCTFEDTWFIFKIDQGIFMTYRVPENTPDSYKVSFSTAVDRKSVLDFTVDRLLQFQDDH